MRMDTLALLSFSHTEVPTTYVTICIGKRQTKDQVWDSSNGIASSAKASLPVCLAHRLQNTNCHSKLQWVSSPYAQCSSTLKTRRQFTAA